MMLYVNTTSSAVNGFESSPSFGCHVTSLRGKKVYVRPSLDTSQRSASSGTICCFSSMPTRPLNTNSVIRSEIISLLVIGSRVDGGTLGYGEYGRPSFLG